MGARRRAGSVAIARRRARAAAAAAGGDPPPPGADELEGEGGARARGNLGGRRVPRVVGVTVVIESMTGATGLELKHDRGVPLVYLGFGGMCVTTVVSYLSHSQVWAAQAGGDVLVGGRSNRAKFGFERELDAALDGVPEAGAAAGPPAA